jgi:hypothetical protein
MAASRFTQVSMSYAFALGSVKYRTTLLFVVCPIVVTLTPPTATSDGNL